MKAAIYRRYGPPEVIEIVDLPVPEPKPDEIRVKVHATTVSAGDWRFRGFTIARFFWLPMRFYAGLRRPRRPVLGFEFAGEVDAVGRQVTRFKPGDAVFGESWFGAHAEYLCEPAGGAIALKPETLSYAEAAAVPVGALTALFFLRKAGVGPGQRVLVNGAAGGIGVYAVQLAKHSGAEVTAVCGPANRELVLSLGADAVVDYTKEDFATSGESWDIVFDTQGTVSYSRARRVLTPKGYLLLAVFGGWQIIQALVTSRLRGRKVVCAMTVNRATDVEFLKGLLEAGEIRPVVGARFPLERIAEAHRLAESGHKRGSAVIEVIPDDG